MIELDAAGRAVPCAAMLYRTAQVGASLASTLACCGECELPLSEGSTVAVEYAWRGASGAVFYRFGKVGGPWIGVAPESALQGYAR